MLNASEMAWRWAFDRWQRTSMMTFSSVPRPFIASRLKSIDLLIKIIHNKNGKTITVLWRLPLRQTKLPVQESQLVLPIDASWIMCKNKNLHKFGNLSTHLHVPIIFRTTGQRHWKRKSTVLSEIKISSLLICVILTLKNMCDCVGSIQLWKQRE